MGLYLKFQRRFKIGPKAGTEERALSYFGPAAQVVLERGTHFENEGVIEYDYEYASEVEVEAWRVRALADQQQLEIPGEDSQDMPGVPAEDVWPR